VVRNFNNRSTAEMELEIKTGSVLDRKDINGYKWKERQNPKECSCKKSEEREIKTNPLTIRERGEGRGISNLIKRIRACKRKTLSTFNM
jgi:hypothetical protein